jgi:hypothetical protein
MAAASIRETRTPARLRQGTRFPSFATPTRLGLGEEFYRGGSPVGGFLFILGHKGAFAFKKSLCLNFPVPLTARFGATFRHFYP